jgi:Leucine-rich repeat (LRR) protein
MKSSSASSSSSASRQINPKFFEQQAKSKSSSSSSLQLSNNSTVLLKKLDQCKKNGNLNLSSLIPPLTEIPKELFSIYLSFNENDKFWELEPLKSLDFSFNAITSPLPAELLCISTELQIIKLKNNHLTSFYDELPSEEASSGFASLASLRVLDLSVNKIKSLNNNIALLSNLKELLINNNELTSIPTSLLTMHSLRSLDLSNNHISTISASFTESRSMYPAAPSRSAIAGNRSAIPPSAASAGFTSQLSLLLTLNLSNNQLTSFHEQFLNSLTSLESLDLSSNHLSSFPPISMNSHLKFLNLSQNQLSFFPVITIDLPSLSQLFLSYNAIPSLDVSSLLFIATSLSELLLYNNHLSILPSEIEYCQQLKVLDLSNNNLNDLPAAIGYLPHLTHCKVEGNCIRTIRQTMLIKPIEELKKYLRTRGESIFATVSGQQQQAIQRQQQEQSSQKEPSSSMTKGFGSFEHDNYNSFGKMNTNDDENGPFSRPSSASQQSKSSSVAKVPAALLKKPPNPDNEILSSSTFNPFYSREINALISERINDINPKNGLFNLSNCSLLEISVPFLSFYSQYPNISMVTKLDLSKNQFSIFPFTILLELAVKFRITNLSYLNLGQNKLSLIKKERVSSDTNSRFLDVRGLDRNRNGKAKTGTSQDFEEDFSLEYYQSIISSIFASASLTLDLSENQLSMQQIDYILSTYIPNASFSLCGLLLHHNPLIFLSSPILALSNLTSLQLQYCSLTNIDNLDLEVLRLMKYLDLSNNKIKEIPISFYYGKNLEFLSVENNELNMIPTFLGILSKLQTLLVQGNPQKLIRPMLISQGSSKVIEYLKNRHNPDSIPKSMVMKEEVEQHHQQQQVPEQQSRQIPQTSVPVGRGHSSESNNGRYILSKQMATLSVQDKDGGRLGSSDYYNSGRESDPRRTHHNTSQSAASFSQPPPATSNQQKSLSNYLQQQDTEKDSTQRSEALRRLNSRKKLP